MNHRARNLFALLPDYFFEPGDDTGLENWSINLNDAWAWALSWIPEIPETEEGEVYRLFCTYGYAGLCYWAYTKFKDDVGMSQFSPEKEMIIAVQELEELSSKLKEQHVYTKESLK